MRVEIPCPVGESVVDYDRFIRVIKIREPEIHAPKAQNERNGKDREKKPSFPGQVQIFVFR